MCQRTDSEDIAETEFCLNPNEREENKVIHQGWLTAPLIKIKGYYMAENTSVLLKYLDSGSNPPIARPTLPCVHRA